MKNKEIRQVSEDGKIVQITTWDERWYVKTEKDEETQNITQILSYPSSTWISSYYPKGVAYYKWLADKGWDEAEAIKSAAGDRGYRVHQAITKILSGEAISIDSSLENADTGNLEPIALDEYEAVMSFVEWFKAVNPKVVANEQVLFNERYQFAGTMDFLCEIDGETWLIDFKTSQYIWPSYEIQVASYAHTLDTMPDKMAILQLGYKRNKKSYKLTELTDKFELFLAARQIWAHEAGNQKLLQKDYPTELFLPNIQPHREPTTILKK